MNKFIVTFLVGTLGLAPLHAQRTWWLPWKANPAVRAVVSKAANISVSRQLERRVATTFEQARLAQQQNPQAYQVLAFGEPIRRISQFDELNPAELYPEQTFLKNSEQAGLYLAARNNRLVLQEMRQAETFARQLAQSLPALKQAAQATQQPKQWIPWLAQHLPPKTQYLFIGEEHGYPEIHAAVSQLLRELRVAQPQRHIILFTEFLPEGFQWSAHAAVDTLPPYYVQLTPVWDTALAHTITVVGLEPNCVVHEGCTARVSYPSSVQPRHTSVWATLEGARLRNKRWLATLTQYREKFPDALFVVYSGFSHCTYNSPFALPRQFEPVHTFVVTLHPNIKTSYQKSGLWGSVAVAKPKPGPLERLVGQPDFPQQVLYWQDPALAHLSGFNVRVKVPVTLEETL